MNENDTNQQPEIPTSETQISETVPKQSFWKEFIKFIILAAVIIVPIRTFIAQPFIVNGASMDPTFATGQYLIVDQVTYRFHEPERGDVIILKYPREPRTFFIKRIIGLPGETVEMKDGNVTIKTQDNPLGFTLNEPYITPERKGDDSYEITLDRDEYFVMGDNRVRSSDSRSWGPLPKDLIVGRPFARLYPLNHISLFPGHYSEEAIENK